MKNKRNPRRQQQLKSSLSARESPRRHSKSSPLLDDARQIVKEVLLENVSTTGDPRSARLVARMKEYDLLISPRSGKTKGASAYYEQLIAPYVAEERRVLGTAKDEQQPASDREQVKAAIIEALVERVKEHRDPAAAQLLGEMKDFDFWEHNESESGADDEPFAWLFDTDHPDHERGMQTLEELGRSWDEHLSKMEPEEREKWNALEARDKQKCTMLPPEMVPFLGKYTSESALYSEGRTAEDILKLWPRAVEMYSRLPMHVWLYMLAEDIDFRETVAKLAPHANGWSGLHPRIREWIDKVGLGLLTAEETKGDWTKRERAILRALSPTPAPAASDAAAVETREPKSNG